MNKSEFYLKEIFIHTILAIHYDIDSVDIDVALAEAGFLPLTEANIDDAIDHIKASFLEQL